MAFKRSAVRSRLSPPGRLAQLVAHPLDVREVTSSSLVSSTTIEKSELRSDEDGVRISCFHGRIEKAIIHMPGESDYEILRALSFSHIRLSKTVLLQWPQRRSKDMWVRKRYLLLLYLVCPQSGEAVWQNTNKKSQ